jgi:hypothetical protein
VLDLEHVLCAREVTEPMFSEIEQRHVGRERILQQLRGGMRAQDLPAMRGCHDPRCAIDRWAVVVTLAKLGLT